MLQTRSFTIHLTTPSLAESYLGAPQRRTLQRIAWGIAFSLLFHALLLVFMPKREITEETLAQGSRDPLVVRLTPSALTAPIVAPAETPPPPTPRPRPSKPTPMFTQPSPIAQALPLTPDPPEPIQGRAAEPTDFLSVVNANRARRAAAEANAHAERNASGREPSADDIAMANLNRNIKSLSQKEGTSGVFQILSKGHRAAQFSFRGWTGDARNAHRDVIEVDAGQNGNIEIAIIRRMIELIRTHYQGDFNWDSRRLGRVVTLSARVEDSSGLEEFMMKEFF